MNSKRLMSVSGKKPFHIVIAIFLIVCLLIGVLCFRYYYQLRETLANESSGYLQEVSKQIGKNASRTIADNFSALGSIATVLKNSGITDLKGLKTLILQQKDYWHYQNLMLIDEQGIAYNADGGKTALNSDEYLMKTIVDQQNSMSASQQINGEESIAFAVPVHGLTISNRKIAAVAGSYDLATFDQILSLNSFSGEGYAYIVQSDGVVVVRSSSQDSFRSGYNMLNTLTSYVMEDTITVPDVKQDMAKGKSGVATLTIDGEPTYMAYTPLQTNEWCLFTFVPVSVVNAKSELLLKITILMCSVITILFAVLFAYFLFSAFRHRKKLERIAFVDPVTGGNTEQRFYDLAQDRMNERKECKYALIYINIEKFKVLNEQFGRNACDAMLKNIYRNIEGHLTEKECMGRLFADNFCILAEYENDAARIDSFKIWYEEIEQYYLKNDLLWLSPAMEFGVYVIEDQSMPFSQMIDRAKLALRQATQQAHRKLYYAVYDDSVGKQLFREKHLEDMMEEALENGEFEIYLQPKYIVKSEKIGGAEALVRWNSRAEGMIYPDEFIPLFEKNGFIIRLDLWVFEQVCKAVRAWTDAGWDLIKVSVNCSRTHLENPKFLDKYIEICEKTGASSELIEIELTESVVFEDVEHLTQVINSIHKAGFGCSMDDFGSGYSSLNLIQYIPVDTIKLDRVFFKNANRDIYRTKSVVGSILSMSKLLKMKTVAEGVEERSVVDFLKELGCDYIQGYYFAKPMPIDKFEKMAFNKPLVERSGEENNG